MAAVSDAERRHYPARSSGQWYRHLTVGDVYGLTDKVGFDSFERLVHKVSLLRQHWLIEVRGPGA